MSSADGKEKPLNRRKWLVAAGLAVIAFANFVPALSCQFVNLDDADYVTQNPNVREGLGGERALWALRAVHSANWHPLTWLSLQLDASLWRGSGGELDPRGFHFTNVLLHAVSAALLFLAFEALTGALWRSAVVALLFAIHPLRVESVAWISERKDVLSTLFGLAALWAYAAYVNKPSVARYLAVFAALLLSLLSKGMLVTLPFLLLVLDWWPLSRVRTARDWWPLVREKVPLLALAVAVATHTYYAQESQGSMGGSELFPLSTRIGNAVVTYAEYLKKTAWPVGLSIFYPYPVDGLSAVRLALSFLVLATITVGAVALRHRAPYLLTGWLWYVGTLVPVIGLVQVGGAAYADRYTYFPQIGILLAVCWGVAEVARNYIRVAAAASVAAAVALGLLTWNQIAVWKDSAALWNNAVLVTGPSAPALNFLGQAREQQGRDDEAAKAFAEACEVAPYSSYGFMNLGKVRLRQGRTQEAEKLFSTAIGLEPPQADAHTDLGVIALQRGDFARAAQRFRVALQIAPNSADAHKGLGFALVRLGKVQEGIAELRAAVDCDPRAPQTHALLGSILEAHGDLPGAAEALTAAARFDPHTASRWISLGTILARQRQFAEAVSCFEKAVVLDPSSTEARGALEAARRARDAAGGTRRR
jgi:tetratricopeptide (TPR) repeat protein